MAQRLSNLPLGALVKFGKHIVDTEAAQPIIWRVVDKNHSGYPSNSVTLIADKIIDLRVYDVEENLSDEYKNGNPNYKISNINQWLTSSASAGQWYTAAYSTDRAPIAGNQAAYADLPGFLYNFTADERVALLPTTLTNQHGANVSTSFVTTIFLPSVWEILGTGEVADGSSQFAYFINGVKTATATTQVISNTNTYFKPSTVDDPYKYATRSTEDKYVKTITHEGKMGWESPKTVVGIRPCINLKDNAKISDMTDSDGCYTVSFNTAPIISETNKDLGKKDIGFTQTYTVTDSDSRDTVTVTEYIDNTMVYSYDATSGATNTFDVQNATWLGLANGTHTMKIVATDGFDTAERTFTFTKSVAELVVQRSTPIASNTRPRSIIVSVVKNIPTEAIFTVEACNNGFDAEEDIVWEDITNDVVRGEPYDFNNTSKRVAQWGVNVRVTVKRNGSEGACYITEIGGNFE